MFIRSAKYVEKSFKAGHHINHQTTKKDKEEEKQRPHKTFLRQNIK